VKSMLKPPGIKHLRVLVHCYVLISTFAFKFNLRRYSLADVCVAATLYPVMARALDAAARARQGLTLVHFSAQRKRFLCDRGCI